MCFPEVSVTLLDHRANSVEDLVKHERTFDYVSIYVYIHLLHGYDWREFSILIGSICFD